MNLKDLSTGKCDHLAAKAARCSHFPVLRLKPHGVHISPCSVFQLFEHGEMKLLATAVLRYFKSMYSSHSSGINYIYLHSFKRPDDFSTKHRGATRLLAFIIFS